MDTTGISIQTPNYSWSSGAVEENSVVVASTNSILIAIDPTVLDNSVDQNPGQVEVLVTFDDVQLSCGDNTFTFGALSTTITPTCTSSTTTLQLDGIVTDAAGNDVSPTGLTIEWIVFPIMGTTVEYM